MPRVPDDAYQHYVGLGTKRTYEAVARHCGVSKRAITRKAVRERWQERLAKSESLARDRFDERLLEDMDSMNLRHLKMLSALQGRALEALKVHPIHSAAAAARALDAAIGRERAIRGAPDALRGTAAQIGPPQPTLLDLLMDANELDEERKAARVIDMPRESPADARLAP